MAEAGMNSVEHRIEQLLSEMTLEEKVGQLKARCFNWRKIFTELFEGLTEREQTRVADSLRATLARERGLMESITAKTWNKYWKDTAIDERGCAIGELSCLVRYFSPREGAELVNRIQKYVKENTRLKIPVMVHDESLHGCMAKGSTSFPQAIALASSWNPDLMREVSTVIGKETRVRGIHHCLSPTINIARDPRCGRTEETYGEDPYLATMMAIAFVEGVQGQRVVTTPKHFVANFVGDGGRDSYETHFSERILREVYLPAFKACVEKAGALSVMAAYNAFDGTPCSCSRWLLTELLRDEWNFKGIVVSDYYSVTHIHTKHAVAETKAEAAKKALEAGLDMELPESDCFEHVLDLVHTDKLSEQTVDEAVRRVLRLKLWAGLFDNPYTDPAEAESVCDCVEHRELARRAARECIVLLKNNGILPLSEDTRTIAVLGPNADTARLGGYSTCGTRVITPLEGIRNKVSLGSNVRYAQGCSLNGDDMVDNDDRVNNAVNIVRRADVAVLCLGNSVPETEGEQKDRCNLDLPGVQEDLILGISKTGTPIIVVLINGSAITMTRWLPGVEAVIEAWYPGEEGGSAIADVIFGDYNPGGKLPITFPKTTGQLPLYYNHKPTGRVDDYVDLRGAQPLFPFGHGLSYTQFEYSNLQVIPDQIDPDGTVEITFDIKNCGKYRGEEVVQLYIRDRYASVSRPVKELKRFKRLSLEVDEEKKIRFTLERGDLSMFDQRMNLIVEPGIFEVMIGSSSKDIRLIGQFEVRER